jgi:pectate lyase
MTERDSTVKHNLSATAHYASVLALILTCVTPGQSQPIAAIPDGYASQNGGTTGGGKTAPVTVTTASAFRSAVEDNEPAVVVVQGKLKVGDVRIGSNKTVIGADRGSGLYGGCVGVRGANCIFQNLIIGPSGSDAMELSGAKNVFIHKCEFVDGADGSLDIVRESDYVTVSWCKFYYVNQKSHRNTLMIGNRDDRTSDAGKLHVTVHHTWFSNKCNSRQPRVRYGHVHLYNNYYNNTGNAYCVGIGVHSRIRLENSHFDSINNPWNDMGGMKKDGQLGWKGIKFEKCSQPDFAPNKFPVFEPPYSFVMDKVEDVKRLLMDPVYGAGNRLIRHKGPSDSK